LRLSYQGMTAGPPAAASIAIHDSESALDAESALAAAHTSAGSTVAELSRQSPVLLVFLRHTGCTFCREALSDLAKQRASMERLDTQLVLVHLGDAAAFAQFAAQYGLGDVPRVADPERKLYQALGLHRGSLFALLHPRVWWRGLQVAILKKHGFGVPTGDVAQLPGVFLIRDGRVVTAHRHRFTSERPDYLGLCQLPPPQLQPE